MASEKKVKISLLNDLQDYEKHEHDIEVWGDDPNKTVEIKPKEEKVLKVTPNSGNLKIHIKTKAMPARKSGLKGFKIIPGTKPGSIHHIETIQKGNKFIAVLHYKTKNPNKGEKGTDRDPSIIHPDSPGGQGE